MKKQIWIHVGMVAAMLAVSLIYFFPALNGKIVRQGDIQSFEAMVKETKDYHEQTGEYAHWNSAMFSGMPGYQVGGNPPVKSIYQPVQRLGTLGFLGMDRNAGVLFFYLIGFYIALMALGCKPWISLIGALAFGLGSYNIIIIEAGHITKAWSLAMVAPILAGMILSLRKPRQGKDKWKDCLWGGILFTAALGLQLLCNHIQITYYTVIGALMLGLTYAVVSIRQHYFKEFLIAVGILVFGAALAFACNSRTLMVSEEYSKVTMRGGNELTVTPADLYGESNARAAENTSNGLDINYAFAWSYGVGETYTLLVPGAMGGAGNEPINPDKSQFAKKLVEYGNEAPENAPLYWGGQPGTSGPVYFGAIVLFLFLLGIIVVKGADRWWILAASLLSILLSWGINFLPFNGWLFENLPLYNKFRTPSMALILANVCMVLMASLTLKHIFDPHNTESDRKRIIKGLYISAGSLLLIILGVMVSGALKFGEGYYDTMLRDQYHYPEELMNALKADRESLFMGDSIRSLILILLAAGTLLLYAKHIIKKAGVAMAVIGALIVIDLWSIDRRYLNDKNFIDSDDPEVTLSFAPQYEETIDKIAAQMGDTNYRVYNLVGRNPFNNSFPSAYHHQIGGYSAVKMSRYQNLIDFYINYGNPNVFNMLNTRYIVTPDGQVQRNPDALGTCWLVDSIKAVDNANDEILSLHDIAPATTAVVNTQEFPNMAAFSPAVAGDTLWMEHQTPYNPDYLKYHCRTSGPRLAVFSEIYYAPDWRAYIDGQAADYFRVNYVLRGLVIPAGDHTIEFKNEAPRFNRLETLGLVASIFTLLAMAGAIVVVYRKKKKETEDKETGK